MEALCDFFYLLQKLTHFLLLNCIPTNRLIGYSAVKYPLGMSLKFSEFFSVVLIPAFNVGTNLHKEFI